MKVGRLLLVAGCAWLAGPAIAGAADYDTSAATISCNTFIGTVSSKPTLTLAAQPGTELTIKGTIGGCTVTGAIPADPALQVISGKVMAKLAVTGDASCATLIEGFQSTGDFVFKWKAASGQHLDFPTTTFTPDAGGLVAGLVPVVAGTYGGFSATGTLAAGSAFAAGTPTLLVVSSEDIMNMFGQCCTDPMICTPAGKGIKKLHIGIGQIQM